MYLLSPSGNYFVPEWGEWQNFVDYIKDLPLIPHPEVKKLKKVFQCHVQKKITLICGVV